MYPGRDLKNKTMRADATTIDQEPAEANNHNKEPYL
jgi:hypothetical protein